jgi:hypothetical protein
MTDLALLHRPAETSPNSSSRLLQTNRALRQMLISIAMDKGAV